jgi:hypothetical protein
MSTSPESAELVKHKLALEQEAHKWGYRKLELQYLEAGQHLRSLNQLMWQVPGMAIAITGGLWYGATTVESSLPRTWVFVFTAIVDVLTVVILWRLRERIQIHIDHQSNFSDQPGKKDGRKRTVIVCWSFALLTAAFMSMVAAYYPEALAKKPAIEQSRTRHDVVVEVVPQQCVSPRPLGLPLKTTPKTTRPCTP